MEKSLRPGGTLHLEQYEDWNDLRRLRHAWEALLAESRSRTIFLTREWLEPWWNSFGARRRLVGLAASEGGDELAGLALLYRERRRIAAGISLEVLRLVGDGSTDSDSLDFLARPGCELLFAQAVLGWCAQHESEWDILELNTVPAESPVASAIASEMATRGWLCWQQESVHQIVRLPGNWEEYLGSLSRNMRTAVNTKIRRIEKRYQVRQRRCEKPDDLPLFLEHLFAMHTSRWQLQQKPGSFGVPARRQFYGEMAQHFLERGWLDFSLLELDGKVAAAEFGFRYGETYYFLQSGFDPAYASDSVGFVLKAQIFRGLIHDGIKFYDFLGEDDPYKLRWGAETHMYIHRRCARPGSRGALYIGLARAASGGKAWLRGKLPKQAWGVLSGSYRRLLARRNPGTDNSDGAAASGDE